ncbi:hypothetical protein [Oleiagrimonas sp. C23AA]|uniref:XAC0095 family protein n=1 Tax=Oleiagrimonas sp. C23AA TaxID=2719047 RepID=UPI00141DEB8F|nr:hypothetical protein [Oleiagrimonas sp. C23AA]NII10159.1 hypothetical protein [Oleiagrimonas sp. C23AA]
MSNDHRDDADALGYFLPEDSQFRLKKLHEYVTFLSHVAQPRQWNEQEEAVPDIRVGEVAICLELLAEQLEAVLGEVISPVYLSGREATLGEADESAAPAKPSGHAPSAQPRYPFGVTLDQIDELNLLLGRIAAHGDVVIASHEAEFADHTLSLVGDMIFREARQVRDIVFDIASQMLDAERGSNHRVDEAPATYGAGPAYPRVDGLPPMVVREAGALAYAA